MKSKFLKIAGVKSEEEFYLKYPTEEAFFNAHPEARSMKKGGSIEAFPQTITESNFFSYGVPAPPNYLKDGGMPTLYPQIQSEEQFFLPIYTNSHNAYAYGGTPEVFPQVGPVNYQPPVNMPLYMDEGGTATPPDQYPVQQGVNNTTGNFVNWLKNKSYNASEKEASKNAMGMFKNGGNHSGYGLPYMEPVRTIAQNGDAGKGNATTPSGLTQDDFNKYMNAWFQSQMGQSQQPVNDMRGFVPSLYAYNYDPRYKFTARNAQGLLGRGSSNMPLIHAMLPELYSGEKTYAELSQDPNFKNRLSTLGLTGYSERDRGLFGKRKERTYTFGTPSEYNLDGKVGSGKLPDNIPSNYTGPSANNSSVSVPPVQGTPWLPDYLQPKPVDNSPMPGPVGMNFSPNPNLTGNTQSNPSAPGQQPVPQYPSNIQKAMDWNFTSRQGSYPPSGGWQEFPGSMEKTPVGPVNFDMDMRRNLQYNADDYIDQNPELQTPMNNGMMSSPSMGSHQRPVTKFSSDPATRKKQEAYNKLLGYKSGGLIKAQGGLNFTPDDTPGDMPVNPMGVNPSGLTEEQMRNVVADDSFGINPTGKDYTTVTEKEKGPFAGMFSDFNTNQFYKRAVTNALNSRNRPDTMLIEDTITGINPAMNFGQDPLSKKQMSNMFGNYAIQQDRGLYMESGGQYSVGDEIEMTPEELQAFIQMGGQVDFI